MTPPLRSRRILRRQENLRSAENVRQACRAIVSTRDVRCDVSRLLARFATAVVLGVAGTAAVDVRPPLSRAPGTHVVTGNRGLTAGVAWRRHAPILIRVLSVVAVCPWWAAQSVVTLTELRPEHLATFVPSQSPRAAAPTIAAPSGSAAVEQ